MKKHHIIVHFLNSSFFFEFEHLHHFVLLFNYYNSTLCDSISFSFNIDYNALNNVIHSIHHNIHLSIVDIEHYLHIFSFFNIEHNLHNLIWSEHLTFSCLLSYESLIIEFFLSLHEHEFYNFKFIHLELKELTLELALLYNFNLQIDYDDIVKFSFDPQFDDLIISLCHSNEIFVFHDEFLCESDYLLFYEEYEIKNWQIHSFLGGKDFYYLPSVSELELYQGCIHTLIIEYCSRIHLEDFIYMQDIKFLYLWNMYSFAQQISFEFFENVEMLFLQRSDEFKVNDDDLIHLENIEFLYLNYNYFITDKGLQYLENIEFLSLQFNKFITDDGLEFLTNIEYLNLNYNENITNEGLQYLINIKYLYLKENENITYDGIESLTNIETIVCKNFQFNAPDYELELFFHCYDDDDNIICMHQNFQFEYGDFMEQFGHF